MLFSNSQFLAYVYRRVIIDYPHSSSFLCVSRRVRVDSEEDCSSKMKADFLIELFRSPSCSSSLSILAFRYGHRPYILFSLAYQTLAPQSIP